MLLAEKDAVLIEEREKEIVSIVRSISEISEMYRDLATIVVDQVINLYIRGSLAVVGRTAHSSLNDQHSKLA